MGVVPASAADPLFYSHHANVDRYWQWWQKYNGDKIPTPQAFLDQYFYFYDEQQRFVRVRADQLMSEASLGYSYDPPSTPWCPLESVDLLENTAAKSTALMAGAVLSAPGAAVDALHIAREVASGNLPKLLRSSCFTSIPVRVRAKVISGKPPVPGVYYLVQLAGHQSGAYTLGGFGIFAGPHTHGSSAAPAVAIAGCIDDKLWNHLRHWKGDRYLLYGPPDSGVTGVPAPRGQMEITGFDLLVPEGLLSTGTAWLKEHALL